MRYYLTPPLLILLFCACKQEKTNSTQLQHEQQITLPSNSSLDSIDKTNQESIAVAGTQINKAYVYLSKGDSTIHVTANMRKDHRIFGYAQPNLNSERLILFSIFTNDVANNPFNCQLGAYYDTSEMDHLTISYLSTKDNFVKAIVMDESNQSAIIYLEKKWVEVS